MRCCNEADAWSDILYLLKDHVRDAVFETYERHLELDDGKGGISCSCGFVPKHRGGLGYDIVFQHISGAIASAAAMVVNELHPRPGCAPQPHLKDCPRDRS